MCSHASTILRTRPLTSDTLWHHISQGAQEATQPLPNPIEQELERNERRLDIAGKEMLFKLELSKLALQILDIDEQDLGQKEMSHKQRRLEITEQELAFKKQLLKLASDILGIEEEELVLRKETLLNTVTIKI